MNIKWLDELLIDKDTVHHDVIDDDDGYNNLQSLLVGSNVTIEKLDAYILENHIKQEKYTSKLDTEEENYYKLNGNAYFLSKEQWTEVTNIIADCNNLAVLNKTLSKSPNISYKYTNMYKEVYENIKTLKPSAYQSMLSEFEEHEVVLIIRKVLNNLLIEQFQESDANEFLFPYKKVCKLLGIEFGNLYVTNNIFYKEETEGYEPDLTNKGKLIIRPKYKLGTEEYKSIIESVTMKIVDGSISIGDYMTLLSIDIKHEKTFEYLNAVFLNQYYIKKQQDESFTIEDYNKQMKASESITHFTIYLGELVTNSLIEKGMFKNEPDARGVPYLKLGHENMYIELTASSIFTKPMLMNERIMTKSMHKIRDKFSILLKTKESFSGHTSNVKLYPKSPLKEVLEQNTKYKVALSNYNEFIKYIEEILDLPFDRDNPNIQAFLWVYDLDFKEILDNTQHLDTVERLMKFGLKLDIIYDKELLKACKSTSESCLRLYHVIISHKYHLKGLLNDLAIFKRFNYFYLPRGISSTGRMFTIPYFMNLQGIKLTKAFIIMHKVSDINAKNYTQVIKGILSVIDTEESRKKLLSMTYSDYTLRTRELMKKYVIDFLKNESDLVNYPKTSQCKKQIEWLSLNCKKRREIFYVRLLINEYNKESNQSLIYNLDATSSGLQLIGIMMKTRDICLISNINGLSYFDIYSIYIAEFNLKITEVKDQLKEFYNRLGITSKEENLMIPESNIEEVDMNNFKEVFLLFINTPLESIKPLISKLLKSIKLLPKRELDLLNQLMYNNDWVIDKDYTEILRYISTIGDRMSLYNAKYILLERLIYIHASSSYFIALQKNPWLIKTNSLNKRNLSKKVIMAFPYNMGYSGRMQAFKEYFTDEAHLNGIDFDVESITPLIRTLNSYFKIFQRNYLADAKEYLTMIKSYINYHIPSKELSTVSVSEDLLVENQYIKWVFQPYETKMKRITLSKHQLHIYKNTGFVNKEMALRTFSAIYIHSADAYIAYGYLELTSMIEKELKSKGLRIKVGIFTNQDNFGISNQFSYFLKIILKESYNSFADSNYLYQLCVETTDAKIQQVLTLKTIYCTNDYFVKH